MQAKSFPLWEPVNFSDVLADPHSEAFKNLFNKLVPNRVVIFELLQKLGGIIGNDGLDLLYSLLHVDPDKRITVTQALAHPFIDSGEELDEISCYLDQFHELEYSNMCREDYLQRQSHFCLLYTLTLPTNREV